jgi:hypothetical protein
VALRHGALGRVQEWGRERGKGGGEGGGASRNRGTMSPTHTTHPRRAHQNKRMIGSGIRGGWPEGREGRLGGGGRRRQEFKKMAVTGRVAPQLPTGTEERRCPPGRTTPQCRCASKCLACLRCCTSQGKGGGCVGDEESNSPCMATHPLAHCLCQLLAAAKLISPQHKLACRPLPGANPAPAHPTK